MTTTDPTAMTGTVGWPGTGRVSVLRSVPGEGAACAGVDAGLREAFFSTDPVQVAAAQGVCAWCPVQLRCLAGALARDEQWGVWGGWVFGPRVIEAVPRPIPHDDGRHDSSADPSAGSGTHGVGWEVWTTDLDGRRTASGRFASETEAAIAAMKVAREGRWLAQMGARFATIFDELVSDSALHPVVDSRATTATRDTSAVPQPQLLRNVTGVSDVAQDDELNHEHHGHHEQYDHRSGRAAA